MTKENKSALRMRAVARRMVGMYRLMDEQAVDEKNNSMLSYVAQTLSYAKWRNFKNYVKKNLHEQLTSTESMVRTIKTSSEETGSLKDLLWGNSLLFPTQAFSIKVGNIMESSIREFLVSQSSDMSDDLTGPIKQFAGYRIQTDVAIKKDNAVVVSELKYNFNVDTEKAKAVVEKLDLLNLFLKDYYRKYDSDETETTVSFVSLRYPTDKHIPKLKPVLESIRSYYIIGYQQLFNFFNMYVTETMWKNLHKDIGMEIRKSFEKNKRYV